MNACYSPRRYYCRDHDCNRGAIFVSRIKSQVIMGSGDHARARGIEGQVMREREKGSEGRKEVTARVVSELVPTLYQAADDALRNISRAYRTAACPR